MIKLNELKKSNFTADVLPSNNLFKELGNNTYSSKDLYSELIDNSVANGKPNRSVDVKIEMIEDDKNLVQELRITDNAKGIERAELGKCISPAGKQTEDGLNEHGLGMKAAVSSLGELHYLATKTSIEEIGSCVTEFRFGPLDVFDIDDKIFNEDSGTIISIKNIKPTVSSNLTHISRDLVPYLGARYRRYLRPDNKKLNISIEVKDKDDKVKDIKNVEEVKPIYFHPNTRKNQPVLENIQLKGKGWSAELTFGYAPTSKSEYEELGMEEPSKFHPYHVSLNKQGLDIIYHDRVMLFHQLSELNIKNRHPDFNKVRGEIVLKYGFKTSITKNQMIWDENFKECINKVSKILNGEEPATPKGRPMSYLERTYVPDEIPEKLLRQRLSIWLKTNPLVKKTSVNEEYVVEGLEGYVDIYADAQVWELKTDQAKALDVYQAFMYIDNLQNVNTGYLVAKSFSAGAKFASQQILSKHGISIELMELSALPITHAPTQEEREKYYK